MVHSRILVENPNGSSSNGHDFNFGFSALNATGLAVEVPDWLSDQPSRTGLAGQSRKRSAVPYTSSGPSTSTFGTQVMTGVPVTMTYAMTFVPGKSVADLQIDSVREAFTLQCGVSTAAVTFESETLDGCPSWDLTSRRLQATTNTKVQVKIFLESSDATRRVVDDLVAAASSASFRASVGAGLSIIDVPHVAFGNLVNSSLATLTVTSLNHVTKMLSPAFNADTIFYEVNATSLTYTVDACASSEAATGLNVNRQAVPAIYIMHSTAPAYQENRVLVSACDTTTTTYVVHAFFRPVPCDCYAGTCNSFDGSCVCDAEYGSSCKT